ncbi:zinc finger, C2H2 type, partial [Opisthorchis viverrini]
LVNAPWKDKRRPVDCERETVESVANICCERGEICNAGSVQIQNTRNSSSVPDATQSSRTERLSDNEENSLWCNTCSRLFASAYSKHRHDFGVHNNERPTYSHRKCPICGLTCVSPSALKKHMMRHSATCEFLCDYCGKIFKHPMNLKRHVVREHPVDNAPKPQDVYTPKPKTYECTDCKQRFLRPAELKRHSVVHTRERPFVCTLCGNEYSRSDNLKRHLRVDHQEKQMAIVCSTEFRDEQSVPQN